MPISDSELAALGTKGGLTSELIEKINKLEAPSDLGLFDADKIVLGQFLDDMQQSSLDIGRKVSYLVKNFSDISSALNAPSSLNYFTDQLAQEVLAGAPLLKVIADVNSNPLLVAVLLDYMIKADFNLKGTNVQGKTSLSWAIDNKFLGVAMRICTHTNTRHPYEPYEDVITSIPDESTALSPLLSPKSQASPALKGSPREWVGGIAAFFGSNNEKKPDTSKRHPSSSPSRTDHSNPSTPK